MALCPSAVFHKGRQYADEEPLFAGQGFGICEATFEYQPRHPEESILYRVVAENLESFLAPAATFRPSVVPEGEQSIPPKHPGCSATSTTEEAETKPKRGKKPRNYSWAQILKRLFDQSTNCMPRPRNNYIRPSYAPLSSPVGTGSRLC
jgi:hypothetical protein